MLSSFSVQNLNFRQFFRLFNNFLWPLKYVFSFLILWATDACPPLNSNLSDIYNTNRHFFTFSLPSTPMAFSKLPFIIAMLLLIIFNFYIILVNIGFGLFEMFFEHFTPSTMWRSLLHNMHFFFIWYLRFDGSNSHTTWTTRLGLLPSLHNNHHFSSFPHQRMLLHSIFLLYLISQVLFIQSHNLNYSSWFVHPLPNHHYFCSVPSTRDAVA